MNDTVPKENPTIHELLAAQLALHADLASSKDKEPMSEGESWNEFVAKQTIYAICLARKCSAKRSR
jgi:hypothetical protein